MLVYNGSLVDVSNTTVSTSGAKAHGIQAGANGNNADGTDYSIINLSGDISVTTTGDNSFGLHAIDGGKISGAAKIITNGTSSYGAFSESYSTIDLSGGSIDTAGSLAYGLLANNDRRSEGAPGGVINAAAMAISTGADWTYGAYAKDGGTITLDGGSIKTTGERSYGILAGTEGKVTSSANIETTGQYAHGVQAGESAGVGNGAVELAGGSITTSGAYATGLHAIGGGSIFGTTTIKTAGSYGYGAFAESDSGISLHDATITTQGDFAFGLLAGNDEGTVGGVVNATNTDIITAGNSGIGVAAIAGGQVSVTGGSITTHGEYYSVGAFAAGGGRITLSDASITTHGLYGYGVAAIAGGQVSLTGGSITTINDTGESTQDDDGSSAYAIYSSGEGSVVLADGTTIHTLGQGAHGALVDNGGEVDLKNGAISTSGVNAYVAQVQYGSTLTISDSALKSEQGIGISLTDAANVTLNNTSIVSNGETFASNLRAAGQTQNITLGDGTVATQNNGTLLKVTRSADGGDGIVNLNLQAGSTASGDIIDTDTTKTSGVTNVNVAQGATFNGKIEGIKDLVAQSGTDLTFEAGTKIAGGVTGTNSTFTFDPSGGTIDGGVMLNAGSSTHGGSMATPITVGGSVVVDQTSFMGGNWQIAGNVDSSGIIAPGNSVGRIALDGNLTLDANSVYNVEVNGNGESDLIQVGGTANLAGTVKVSSLGGYLLESPYTILTAGSLAGTRFSDVSWGGSTLFIDPALSYDANNVFLTLARNDVAFSSVAKTSNQRATTDALDNLSLSNPLTNSVAFLDASEAGGAFDQLSGDTYASVKTGLIDTANLTADAINNRLRSAFAGVAAKEVPVLSYAQAPRRRASQPFDSVSPAQSSYDYAAWASGFGSWVDHDGNANAGRLKTSTGGFLSGVDVGFASGWRLGVVGGYSHTDLDAKDRYASANSDNWHLGIYGGNQWGPLGLRAGLVQTWHNIDSSRSVAYTGFNDGLDADYHARTLQAFGELGYRIDMAAASFEPFANLSYVSLHTDGFTERGGAAALSVDSDTTNTTFTTLGLRASAPLQLGSTTANLKGTLGWRHAYGDTTPESTQFFAGSNAFTVDGVAIAKDAALVEAGFDVAITKASTFGVSYVGQFGNGTTQNGFNASLNVKF
ncbi:MAG: hypothetical protein BGP07_09555 [Rhizobiales bacterium 63-22]|nr:MAG: hypothetical protein BGP07_09555 [Rhizobiales bacterium 63-22]